jgi:osmotically inducible lipoprotein OsmB
MNTLIKIAMVMTLLASMAGCSGMSTTEKRTLGGAGIGAASGALIGGMATGRPLEGAAIGTVVGAGSGWLYDRHERSIGY